MTSREPTSSDHAARIPWLLNEIRTHAYKDVDVQDAANIIEWLERERKRLQDVFDRATKPLSLDDYREYITSGNAVPVTRCQLSASHLLQLIKRAEVAEELARHLQGSKPHEQRT